MDCADRMEIHELMALYGFIIDERQWSRIDELFTDDVVYDVADVGLGVLRGTDAIRALWTAEGGWHPLAHHVGNVIVSEAADGTVRAQSKVAAVTRSGRVVSFSYADQVRRDGDGRWRICARTIVRRRDETIASPP